MAARLLLPVFLLLHLSAGGYVLNDAGQCSYAQLPCESGQCISRSAWCDGPTDCVDGSDEFYCRTHDPAEFVKIERCDESQYFLCENGMCIPKAGRCNDMPDCKGGEDEENCDYLYETNEDAQPAPSSTTTPGKLRGDTPWLSERVDVLAKAVRRVVESRDARGGWGHDTPRVVTALALADEGYLASQEGLLTRKQLEVQLAIDLMRSSERPLRVGELSAYVSALVAACVPPRDFHGVSVLRLLRRAVAGRRAAGLFVSPAADVALCAAGEMRDFSARRLKNMAYRRSEEPRWLDVQSYALLAISCRASRNASEEWTSLRRNVARNISEWQQPDGSFGSFHSTALALQALIAAAEPGTEGTRERALRHLLSDQGAWTSARDAYYVLPALRLRSLAQLHQRDCSEPARHTQATEGVRSHQHKKATTSVHYSLWVGGERNEIQSLTLRLPRHPHFLQVMQAAQEINPHFKFEALRTGRATTVHALAGRASDPEQSMYWTLYRKVPLPFRPQLSNVTATVIRLRLLGAKRWAKDLHKLHPKDGEHLVYWYKPHL